MAIEPILPVWRAFVGKSVVFCLLLEKTGQITARQDGGYGQHY
jgi:hypothetical protein